MPNIYISVDELWPYYEVDEEEPGETAPFEMTDEEYKTFREECSGFWKWQEILKDKYAEKHPD